MKPSTMNPAATAAAAAAACDTMITLLITVSIVLAHDDELWCRPPDTFNACVRRQVNYFARRRLKTSYPSIFIK